MEDIISMNHIEYSYFGKIQALKDINLSVAKGDMLCIIGLNGSGKSTLLHIINALIFPDSGELSFEGNIISEKLLKNTEFGMVFRQRLGYIFQNPDIQLFCPTVFDELLFGPLQLKIPVEKAVGRAEETMDFMGIRYLKERPVYMLSGGEKKRVAIASVLTINPDVLLVDEPRSQDTDLFY